MDVGRPSTEQHTRIEATTPMTVGTLPAVPCCRQVNNSDVLDWVWSKRGRAMQRPSGITVLATLYLVSGGLNLAMSCLAMVVGN
jgi:hypothetical protein